MAENDALQQLNEMGCNSILSQAAVRQLKTNDVSALIDWISAHQNQQLQWSQWLEENKEVEKPANTTTLSIQNFVNKAFVEELIKKGHSKNVAQKSVLLSNNVSLQSAQKWIQDHKYDPDFEEEVQIEGQAFNTSTLTPEQAKKKLQELTKKARQTRKKREEEEEREREKNRVRSGKQILEAKRLAEEAGMKRQAELDRIQKQKDEQYKKKLVQQMRRERNEKLGLKGEPMDIEQPTEAKKEVKLAKLQQFQVQCEQVKVGMHAYPQKAKVFFETAQIYVNNIIKNNGEEKFRKINKENKAFQGRIVEVFGGVQALMALGYEQDNGFLYMRNYDLKELQGATQILQRYISWY